MSARFPSFGLLLRAYPRWFRDEFGDELLLHLRLQRAEPRYRRRIVGALRFWWEAGSDALATGAKLRLDRARERWSSRRREHREGGWFWVGRRGEGPGTGGWRAPRRRGSERSRVWALLEAIARDVRHEVRGLSRSPGYALVFVVTLGLGIGANTAIFSAVNGVLLRPLPHEEGDRLVYLRHSAPLAGIENALFSVPEIEDYRRGTASLEAVAEFSAMDFTMLGADVPRRVRTGIVTGNYFDVMGLSANVGRTVGYEDDGRTAPAVIVLSDAYWRRVFGADPGVVGTTVEMNGRTATIVGVAEAAPPYPERTDIYVNMAASPHHLDATMNHDRIHRMTEVFGKLAPGATVESVRAEVSLVSSRIHAEYPEAYDPGSGFEVGVTPLKTQLTYRARPTLLLLLATATFVLIIACANLANLTLARVLRRGDELAIRASLGGSRATLRRSLLVQNLVLAVLGAGLGLLLAYGGLDLLVTFAERFTSRASEISLDVSVFGYALLAGVAASVFFTLLPPLPDGRRLELMRSGVRSTIGSRVKLLQRGLVVAQIGVSFVLLIGAGLLLRTMMELRRVDPGFDTARILAMDIPIPGLESPAEELRNRYLGILEDVRGLPGVADAALTSSVPLTGPGTFSFRLEMNVEGHDPAPGAPTPRAQFRAVSPEYFGTMGIGLLEGRGFTRTDLEEAPEVVVINESMARAYFGDRHPIGRRIAWIDDLVKFMGEGAGWRTVVGVVADTKDSGLDEAVEHTVYHPYRQITPHFTGSMVVRTTVDRASVLPAIREAILAHDPNQPIGNVATLAELGAESVAPRRMNTVLLGSFALLALVIAAVGIGGVLAFSVGSRRREFGVRSALGAARHRIWSGVLAEGARMAGLGLLLGTAAALLLARTISGLLFGVPALDPVTFVAVGLLIGGVALVAAWIPAWRAAGVSPMEAMRAE